MPAPGQAPPDPVVTATPIAAPAPVRGSQAALLEARSFVYRVRNPTCLSTGTAFDFEGTIVTNRHVAAGSETLQLATWDGRDFSAGVRGHSGSFDLAQVTATPPVTASPPGAATDDPPVGTEVFVTGYPKGNQLTVTAGTVVGTTTTPALAVAGPVLEVSDRVEPGNSGSPLLDSSGRLVGVVFARDESSGDGLAMPLSTLQAFLSARLDGTSLGCAP